MLDTQKIVDTSSFGLKLKVKFVFYQHVWLLREASCMSSCHKQFSSHQVAARMMQELFTTATKRASNAFCKDSELQGFCFVLEHVLAER